MDPDTFTNALFLCLLNVSLMVAGIFLNSVVIISICRSSQHRKKLFYSTILFLSCFDLAEVIINHPALILSTILWSLQIYYEKIMYTFAYTGILFGGFSMFALLTLTIERFLALTYPFFHQTAVTKRRLVFFQTFWMITLVALSPFYVQKIGYMLINVFILSLLFLLICLNYKMFIIAKSKRKEGRVGQTSATTSSHQQRKRRKLNFKNISTCSLAVACFSVSSFPKIIYCAWRFTSKSPFYDRQVMSFALWSCTFLAMNSTFNCLIFFWRNSILRREGMKVVKCFRFARS